MQIEVKCFGLCRRTHPQPGLQKSWRCLLRQGGLTKLVVLRRGSTAIQTRCQPMRRWWQGGRSPKGATHGLNPSRSTEFGIGTMTDIGRSTAGMPPDEAKFGWIRLPLINNRLPCLGIQVKHTTSNGDRWAFGWVSTDSMDTLNPTIPAATSVELVAPNVLEGMLHSRRPRPVLNWMRHSCGDGDVFQTLLPESTLCDNVWQWQLPCSLSAGHSVVIECNDLVDTLWLDGSGLLNWGDLAFTEIMADPPPRTTPQSPPTSKCSTPHLWRLIQPNFVWWTVKTRCAWNGFAPPSMAWWFPELTSSLPMTLRLGQIGPWGRGSRRGMVWAER